MTLRRSTFQIEGPYRASKWLSIPVLLSGSELKNLTDELEAYHFYDLSQVDQEDCLVLSQKEFVSRYHKYIESMLGRDQKLLVELVRGLNLGICYDTSSFYKISIGNDRFTIKNNAPIIQIHPFCFRYDHLLHKFIEQVRSDDAIFFGLEFRFPQIFQDPKSFEIIQVYKDQLDVSAQNFKKLRSIIRDVTRPAKFLVKGEKKIASFRVGLEAKKIAKELVSSNHDNIEFVEL